MSQTVNWLGLAALLLVQSWISWTLLRAAGRFASAQERWAARAAACLLFAAVMFCYGLAFFSVARRSGLLGPVSTLLAAAARAYLVVATVAAVVYAARSAIRKRLDADTDLHRRRALNLAANLAMAGPFAVLAYGSLVERTDFRVRELDVPLPGLPPDLDGLRILQLSDIHLSPFLSEAELARAIDIAAGLGPHVAVITGDLISSPGDPLDACIRQLARIRADAGVFGCMGNHERYAHVEDHTARAAAAVGIRFLRGHAQPLRFGGAVLNLAGVDYQTQTGRDPYLRNAGALVVPGACNVLLSHNPDVFPVAAAQGWNLTFSGHTHGGQVTVEILDQSLNPARFFTPYVHGLYRLGASAVYVTRGIGAIGFPARIGAPPEITLLRLRKA
ncbi:MAG: metallophosphoesterase [Bryobacteraceae bacterium]